MRKSVVQLSESRTVTRCFLQKSFKMVMVIALAGFFTHASALAATDPFKASEILCRPTNNSVMVHAVAGFAVDAFVKYGSTSGTYTDQTAVVSAAAADPIVITIQNLQPNTRYYYRLCYRQTGSVDFVMHDEHSFHTQRAPGSTFKFTINADPHLYDKKGIASLMRIAMQNEQKDAPDFVLDLGDTYGDDHNPTTITKEEIWQLHLNYRPIYGMLCHSAPFFFCMGNHEGESGYYLLQSPPDNMAVHATLARKYYFPNPIPDGFYTGNTESEQYGIGLPENYFAWQWGDALFVVVDAYRYYTTSAKPKGWDWTMGKTQYDWLKQTLETSKAKYKFVFAHHVLGETRGGVKVASGFEWGGYEQNGTTYSFPTNRPGWAKPIHQLMVDNGVNIFFQGHDHLYAKETIDSMVYQEVPMPSDTTYEIGMLANADAFTGVVLRGSGHLRVTVAPAEVTVDYVGAFRPQDENDTQVNGKVYHSYTVKANTPVILSHTPALHNAVFGIEQIFPNPVTGTAMIRFRTSQADVIKLGIYDLRGRQVWAWSNRAYEKGPHTVVWDGMDYEGSKAGPGIYICRLQVGNTITSGKIISNY